MRSSRETNKSVLSQLDTYYLPGIEAGFNKTPMSLISLGQFESWWEAFFVTATYTVASAVLTFLLKALLAIVASIAFCVAISAAVAALIIKISDQTQDSQAQVQLLLNVAFKSASVFLMMTLIPAFLIIGMVGLAAYRAKDLVLASLPEDAPKKIQESCFHAYQSAKTGLSQMSVWVSEKFNSSNTAAPNQPQAQSFAHN